MEIRVATERDLFDLVALAKQLWPDQNQSELEEGFNTAFTSPTEVTFIGEVHGAPIGFAICSLRSDYVEGSEESPTGYLEAIFILSEFRQQGLASSLVAHGEQWCRERGCTQMGSDTEINNLVSQQFHRESGFKETNRIVCFIKTIDQ